MLLTQCPGLFIITWAFLLSLAHVFPRVVFLWCYSFHPNPKSEHWWQRQVGLVRGILTSLHPYVKGSNSWIWSGRYCASVWFLPFPDLAGEAAALETSCLLVSCRNNPLQLKTHRGPLRAKTRVLWRIGHSVLLNTALSNIVLQVPFLLHPQPVSMFWLCWRDSVKCFISFVPGIEIEETAFLTGGLFKESIYYARDENRTLNSSSWFSRECVISLGLINRSVDATFSWDCK